MMRPLRWATLAGFAATVALAGCGGDSGVVAATKPTAATPTAQARRQLADARTPASAVARFWGSVQRGALPLSLSLYEPRVVSAVGIQTFAGMLTQQRQTTADTDLNILRVERVSGGQLVTAETVPAAGLKTTHSFFLRRPRSSQPGGWRIAYDTLSASGIQAFVQDVTQRSIDPSATAGRKALSAGDQAAALYRKAALGPAGSRPDGQSSR